MPIERDPEEFEIRHLRALKTLADHRVLEIGTGVGRMTRRFAGWTRSLTGIDLAHDRLLEARTDLPAEQAARVRLAAASATALPFRGESFEVAVLAWSL